MGTYITVAIFIIFDIITGLIEAIYHKSLNSTKLRMGLYHKLSEIITIVGASFLDYGVRYINLNIDFPLLKPIATYICIMELISILENLGEINPQLGKIFKAFLEKLNIDKENNDG